jgi:hypothetical protein
MEVQHDAKEPIPHAAKRLATGMMPAGPLVTGRGLERIRIQSGGEDVTGKPRARLMGLLFAALVAVSPAAAETQFAVRHRGGRGRGRAAASRVDDVERREAAARWP